MEHVHHTPTEVRVLVGPGVYLCLPSPPEGDAYDLQAVRELLAVDPKRLLLSARRAVPLLPAAPPQRSWWRRFVPAKSA